MATESNKISRIILPKILSVLVFFLKDGSFLHQKFYARHKYPDQTQKFFLSFERAVSSDR